MTKVILGKYHKLNARVSVTTFPFLAYLSVVFVGFCPTSVYRQVMTTINPLPTIAVGQAGGMVRDGSWTQETEKFTHRGAGTP